MANEHLTDPKFWEEAEGSEIIAEIQRLEASPEPLSKRDLKLLNRLRNNLKFIQEEAARLAALNKKWQSGSGYCKLDRSDAYVELDPEMAKEIFGEPATVEQQDPNKVYCHHCKKETSLIVGTMAKGPLQIGIRNEPVTVEGITYIEEHLIRRQTKIILCPDCCLLIKPTVDKDGRITNQGFQQVQRV